MYDFIWWGKVVSLSLERVRIVREKVGEMTDVAVVGFSWWAKNWLTAAFALRMTTVVILVMVGVSSGMDRTQQLWKDGLAAPYDTN